MTDVRHHALNVLKRFLTAYDEAEFIPEEQLQEAYNALATLEAYVDE